MGIGSCYRTLRGPYRESHGISGCCTPTADVPHDSGFQKHGLTTSMQKAHMTTPSPDGNSLERNTAYDAHADNLHDFAMRT
jgi:hypothetical protein